MKLNYINTSIAPVITIGLLTACVGGDESDSSESDRPLHYWEECEPSKRTIRSMPESSIEKIGTDSDGELYLAAGETLFLDERAYNFTNIYLESDSIIKVSEVAKNGLGKIQINSLGSCEFYGDIKLENYRGMLEISCFNIVVGGEISTPVGSMNISVSDEPEVVVVESGALIIGSEGAGFIASGTLVVGSVGIDSSGPVNVGIDSINIISSPADSGSITSNLCLVQ